MYAIERNFFMTGKQARKAKQRRNNASENRRKRELFAFTPYDDQQVITVVYQIRPSKRIYNSK